MTHHLKTIEEYFQAVIDRKKGFEIRYNDRGFKVGDRVILEEFLGYKDIPDCPDRGTCHREFDEASGQEYCPLGESRSCLGYRQELYSGRRCLVKIKRIFSLDNAGLEGYVAFTFEILNIQGDKTDMRKQENLELLKLVEANPDLPVVPLVLSELADECGYTVCAFGSVSIDQFTYVEDDYDDDRLYLKSEQGELEEYYADKLLTDNGELTDDEAAEIAHNRAEALIWTKAIIVYIGPSEAD